VTIAFPESIYDKALPTKLVLGFSLTYVQNTLRMILNAFREDINLYQYSSVFLHRLPTFAPPLIFRFELSSARTLDFIRRRETAAKNDNNYYIKGGQLHPTSRFDYLRFYTWGLSSVNGYEDTYVLVLPFVYWNVEARQISELSDEVVLIHQVGLMDLGLSMDRSPTIRNAKQGFSRVFGTLQFRDMFVLCYIRSGDPDFSKLGLLFTPELFMEEDKINLSAQDAIEVHSVLPQSIYCIKPKCRNAFKQIGWYTILNGIAAIRDTGPHKITYINSYPNNTRYGIIANEQTPIVWTRDPSIGYKLLSDYYKAMLVKAVHEQLKASPTENKHIKEEQQVLAKNFLDLLQEVS